MVAAVLTTQFLFIAAMVASMPMLRQPPARQALDRRKVEAVVDRVDVKT